jgi:hypothetical protein
MRTGEYEEGVGKGGELTLCLRKDIWSMGIGQLHASIDETPLHS